MDQYKEDDDEVYQTYMAYRIGNAIAVLGCLACPEQYDVYLMDGSNQYIGYLRLRHGCFRATYPDVGGQEVYVSYPKGDGYFYDDERMFHLTNAVNALLTKHYDTSTIN